MIEQLTDPHNLPFSVSLALMLLLAVVQIVGLGDMIGGDHDVDMDMDSHMAMDAGLMSIIGVGRLPFLMWLMLLLTLFGLIGLSGQQLMIALTGSTVSAWLAGPVAALAALPLTGMIARPLGAILPHDETTAVSVDSLVGREGEIVIGTASRGSPARAKVSDVHGATHHVMVEPDNEGQHFVQGERILLVRREGEIFRAIGRGDHYLPRPD